MLKRSAGMIRFLVLLLWSLWSVTAVASHHGWAPVEAFSNADGTLQFIEMTTSGNGENQLSCCNMFAQNTATLEENEFAFPYNLSTTQTAGKRLLLATSGFQAAHGIAPDYIIPDNFLTTTAGDVWYNTALTWSNGLPTDGVNSYSTGGVTGPGTPTNFSGQTVTLEAPEPDPSFFGRAYHMTASTSPNLSEVHIINTSDSAQSYTGTLIHKSGSQLGDSDVALHEGTVDPQGRLILFSTDLEQRFNQQPWSGPAILDVTSSAQFELMTKLSRNGRVTNTNCVRTGNVHNLEGTDSPDVSYIRFINDGSTTISDIRGTLYDSSGNAIGQANTQYFDELTAREAVFLSRGSIENIVGETWTGVATLVLSQTYENLQLMNLNFVNDETFFNFSCYMSATDQGSTYFGRAYHMTASTSPNLSQVHIINTSGSPQSYTGTLIHKSGSQLGESDVALHEGTIEPQGRLILFSTDLEQRFNEMPWSGPAILDVTSSDQFELMTKLSRNGRVTNTNCIRTANVHNLEGTDSSDVSYIRFINDGSSTISNIRGTLYDSSGNVIGQADTQYFESLGPREAIFLSRGSIENIVGETWTGVATLVLSDSYQNLQLMNLNFVNNETFFNFSCYISASEQSGS